jgi:Peptidase family M23
MTLIWIQLVLPIAMLLWIAFVPSPNRLAWMAQIGATAAVLAVLHFAGLWMMPPWWAPWVHWTLFIAALFRMRKPKVALPATASGWAIALLWVVATSGGLWLVADAVAGRQPPAGAAPDIAMPLAPARNLVVNGGSREIVNAHVHTLGRKTPKQRAYWGQSYGTDIIAIDRSGFQADGFAPTDPRRYRIFGAAVLAPCAGTVVEALDGKADMPVPMTDMSVIAGNHVLLRCGDYDVLLAHFQRGSVRVRAGEIVRTGQAIGRVGNSGASDAPHLHIHAQRPGPAAAPYSGRPVPLRVSGRFLVRGDHL